MYVFRKTELVSGGGVCEPVPVVVAVVAGAVLALKQEQFNLPLRESTQPR